ncbi:MULTISPECIES: HNH endonuclease signature motif containing protein [unclassified Dietzia]|uniref:HNH endonuclease signature motif containing protein n=1 Tax=unclassified Dietzia TaxID=2617939 RepID=UPI001E5D60E9|nr:MULTISPECIES: HNH endonuclease signature motif containing protein [unclassified Dietzia]
MTSPTPRLSDGTAPCDRPTPHDDADPPDTLVPPPGFTTATGPASPVLVPEAFARWDPGQQRGYLTQRTIYAAEGRTLAYAYDCVRSAADGFATEGDPHRDPWEAAATMIGASMALSRHGASRLVTTAVELTERLPRTAALLATGWIGILAAHTIAEETALVADHLMPDVDRRISEGLAPTRRRTHPPRLGPLRKMLLRTVSACDPLGADARAEQSRRGQDVELVPLRDDRAIITATLTAEDALEIADRVEALARTAPAGDPRTLGQLRAAGLLALSRGWSCLPDPRGEHPGDPEARSAARRVVLHAYDDGSPGNRGISLAGYGPVTGHTADELQRDVRHRVTELSELADPDSAAARRHAPSEALAHFCRGRDGTCVFPGCQTPAEKSDLDHIIPFDHDRPERGGHTTCDDLGSLCRFHHRLKTDGVWAYYRDTDGSYVWIHGPHHPDRDPGTRVTTYPTGPLSDHAAPRRPEASRRQREAAEAGATGSGCAESRRRPHVRHRRDAERRGLRAQARLRRHAPPSGPVAPSEPSTTGPEDEPPF